MVRYRTDALSFLNLVVNSPCPCDLSIRVSNRRIDPFRAPVKTRSWQNHVKISRALMMVVGRKRDVMLMNCENVTPCVEVRDERRLLDILYINSFHFYT